jgi:uncharacterized RDD family membrane protein YckC
MSVSENILIRPNLLRHLAVIAYDLFLLVAVLLVAALIVVIVNDGEAISDGNPFFLAYLLLVSFLFYGWFWTHGGQTIGMRSWKVRLVGTGDNITWTQCFKRFITALISYPVFGVGLWWQYISNTRATWPDLSSGTRLHYDKDAVKSSISRLS